MDWFTTGDFNKELTWEAQGLKVISHRSASLKSQAFVVEECVFRLVAHSPKKTLISFEVMVVLNSC